MFFLAKLSMCLNAGTFAIFANHMTQFILGGGGGVGLFALKQWISSSLKHDPRENNFYVNNPPKRIALWE